MAKLIAGQILDKLIKIGFEYLQDEPSMLLNLASLYKNQLKFKDIVSAAKGALTDDENLALNTWIWQLRDAIDEADDLLDDFEYMKHRQQQLGINEDTYRALTKYKNKETESAHTGYPHPSPGNIIKRMIPDVFDQKKVSNMMRLKEVVQKLDKILAEARYFHHILEIIHKEQREQREHQVEFHKTRQIESLPRNDLIGRDKDKEFVIEWLRKPSNEQHQAHITSTTMYNNISLLSIVGDGGMGKTTLLHHVYQDDEITKIFDMKLWICVSDSFDDEEVIVNMLESIIQNSLKSKVMSKKFLLVMDDLWDNENEDLMRRKWKIVLTPLVSGGFESKILITTRKDSIVSMIEKLIGIKNDVLILEGLKDDECLRLLTTNAFDDAMNSDEHKNLESIARELVKKLCGSPLAAKVMGGVLNSSLDERHWRNVLNRSLILNGIFPILKLSYMYLPVHLRSCFSFCSIFAQDHFFDKDDLVRMWIAVGFIQSSHNDQGETFTLEDIGERYFDVLIKKSFFDEAFYADGYTKGYKMHDLLFELAQSVSKEECFRFVGDEKSLLLQIPKTIRHLSFKSDNLELLKNIGLFKNLKTLLISVEKNQLLNEVTFPGSYVSCCALNEMLIEIKSIRLLHVNDIRLTNESSNLSNLGCLYHLRYLRFPDFYVKLLPRNLSKLYYLQFLTIDGDFTKYCSNAEFPSDINNLSNLRYLSSQRLNFPGIGKLKLLQQVNGFCIENENGYRIEELEHMNELCILKIDNLKDVRDAEEACKAKLCDKRKLTFLSLNWNHAESDIADPDLDERLLDKLQPPNYLKTLQIQLYMGARSAIWMNEVHLIKNLENIYLSGCLEWEILPPFGLLPFLKFLWLENMPKVKRVENKFDRNDMCCVFPSLETLCFENLEALVDWFDASVEGLFPCLTKLYLTNCPILKELPNLPHKLETLEIDNVGWKTLNCWSISKSFLLEALEVRRCPNITSISMAGEIDKLKNLTIVDCPNLNETSISPTG